MRSLEAAAERYVRIVLALGDRDEDSLDSYYGPPAWLADARREHATLDDVEREAGALVADLESGELASGDAERRWFLIRQLRAIAARIDLLRGDRPRLADEATRLLGIDIRQTTPTDPRPVYEALAEELPGRGDLTRRLADFDRAFVVPPDRLPHLIERAIAECRSVTAAHLLLPKGDRVNVTYATDMAWSAYTRHEAGFRSRVQINASLPLTVDRALDLACHETYPGHHAMYSLIEEHFRGRVEFEVQPTFSPQSALQESLASGAGELAFDMADRIRFERDVLFPLAELDPAGVERHVRVNRLLDRLHGEESIVAQQYLDGDLDFARASNAFKKRTLMIAPDATLKFLNRFRSYAVAYTVGRDVSWKRLRAMSTDKDPESRWRAFAALVTSPRQTVE